MPRPLTPAAVRRALEEAFGASPESLSTEEAADRLQALRRRNPVAADRVEGILRRAQQANAATEALLAAVYGSGPRDMTTDGVVDRLAVLRREDPLLAKRFGRFLHGPVGQRLFPALVTPWQETSLGLRARLALLPQNPHLELDVRAVRQTLRIPDAMLPVEPGDTVWKRKARLAKPDAVRQLAEDELVTEWLFVHRQTAGRPVPQATPDTLADAAQAVAQASAAVDLGAGPGPDWLRQKPAGDLPGDHRVPIERVAARLIERHRLPPTRGAASRLIRYMLTANAAWLRGWSFSAELVRTSREPVGAGYDGETVTVVGIDAFVTREDWDQIWDQAVAPGQTLRLRLRGQPAPGGPRGVQVAALGKAMPVYRLVVLEGLKVAEALWRLEERRRPIPLDRSKVYAAVRAIRGLPEPLA